jgi:hypothetical protein
MVYCTGGFVYLFSSAWYTEQKTTFRKIDLFPFPGEKESSTQNVVFSKTRTIDKVLNNSRTTALHWRQKISCPQII